MASGPLTNDFRCSIVGGKKMKLEYPPPSLLLNFVKSGILPLFQEDNVSFPLEWLKGNQETRNRDGNIGGNKKGFHSILDLDSSMHMEMKKKVRQRMFEDALSRIEKDFILLQKVFETKGESGLFNLINGTTGASKGKKGTDDHLRELTKYFHSCGPESSEEYQDSSEMVVNCDEVEGIPETKDKDEPNDSGKSTQERSACGDRNVSSGNVENEKMLLEGHACARITMNNYEEDRLLGSTGKNLRDLLEGIHKLPNRKERKKRLTQFAENYPHIFAEKFGNDAPVKALIKSSEVPYPTTEKKKYGFWKF